MDLGSLLLILAVLLVVALFVGRPFIDKANAAPTRDSAGADADVNHSRYLAEYDRLLNAIQEMEFDNTLGKIPAEDYPRQHADLMNAAANVLRAMDELQPAPTAQSAEDRIEALVAARSIAARGSASRERVPAAAGTAVADDALEDLIAKRAVQRKESSAGFCPRCGKPVQKSDVFCPKCGASLNKA